MERRIEFAYPAEVGGKQYKADEAAEVEAGKAADLVQSGVARYAVAPKPGKSAGSKEG